MWMNIQKKGKKYIRKGIRERWMKKQVDERHLVLSEKEKVERNGKNEAINKTSKEREIEVNKRQDVKMCLTIRK